DPLADPDAHRGEAEPAAAPAQLVDEHRHQPGAAGAKRVSEGNRPAIDVDRLGIEPELVDTNDRLRRKRLVELDEIEVRCVEAGPGERLADGWDRADPHDCRV